MTSLVSSFVQRLNEESFPTATWEIEGRSKKVFSVRTPLGRTLLYIKESQLPDKGFWGVGPNVVERLRNADHAWLIVFLVSSEYVGYVVPGEDFLTWIDHGLLGIGHSRGFWEYKIHEAFLEREKAARPFNSIARFVFTLGSLLSTR